MKMTNFVSPLLSVLFLGLAVAQHTDIEIAVENGQLVTSPRIGEGEFGEAPNAPNVADEPGFEAEDGVLPAEYELSFNAIDILGSNLWYWDGIGSVDFGPSPTGLTIQHPVVPLSTTLESVDAGGAAGFLIAAADSEGGLHQDLEFVLADNPPPAGVYLFGLELFGQQPAGGMLFDPSEPLYIVLGSGVDEVAIDAAMGWVEQTLVVPEPQALGWVLLAIGLLVPAMRRPALTTNPLLKR